MFTKKPEREMGGDPLTKMSDRPVTETTPFGERSPSYVKSAGPSKLVPSIIGEDLMITGNVTSKGEIQVDGEIQGDVQCGSLLLGDKSQITGCVLAEDVVVRGRVLGSIRGLRVTLQAQSHACGEEEPEEAQQEAAATATPPLLQRLDRSRNVHIDPVPSPIFSRLWGVTQP